MGYDGVTDSKIIDISKKDRRIYKYDRKFFQ